MAEPNLVLCGGLRRAAAPRAWWRATQVPLEIGGAADVHLVLDQLTDRMCAKADALALDLLEVAAYVHAADQAVTRGGTATFDYGDDWRRWFRFEVPVRCPDVWDRPDVRAELTGALEFLTDDVYEFGFHRATDPRRSADYLFPGAGGEVDAVVLFSGGLDSLCGAVEEVLVRDRRVALLSHRSSTRIFARQRHLFDALRVRGPGARAPVHVHVTLNEGTEHGREFTQRARSFVFAALGAVTARLAGLDRVRFYENGVTSLNLPLGPELVGARASRTTHPQVLARFGRLFALLFGGPFAVENPGQGSTKVELLERLRGTGHADLCARTCSCSHVWGQREEHPHCGRCSQCVDRRVCALAAGLSGAEDPPERYASDPLAGAREGPDLTLAERYVGLARELHGLGSPRAFAVRFPEVNAALAYLGAPPAHALAACHDLYRRHAAAVERGVQGALGALGALNWHTVPAPSLLGIVLGRATRPPARAPAPGAAPERGLVADPDRFEVRFNGVPRQLGNTKEFHFIARLLRARHVRPARRAPRTCGTTRTSPKGPCTGWPGPRAGPWSRSACHGTRSTGRAPGTTASSPPARDNSVSEISAAPRAPCQRRVGSWCQPVRSRPGPHGDSLMTAPFRARTSAAPTKNALSPARRHLVQLLQKINFGRIEGLVVRAGEPVLDPPPVTVREHKFAGENGPRPEAGRPDVALKAQHLDLMRVLDEVRDGTITVLTVKHGLPFHAELPG